MPRSDTQFRPGQSGNPKGRPKGSRNKINERTLKIIAEVQAEEDMSLARAAMRRLRDDDPRAFWRLLTGLLPKQVDADLRHEGDVTFLMWAPDASD